MKKGFTLIELSIVLIIIGLLTGGAFQMLKVMQEKARATEAKQILESAKKAVIAYAINNGKLPTESDFLNMQIRGADNFNLSYYVPTTTTNPPNFLISDLCANIDTGFSTQITKPDDTLEIPTPNIAFVIAINGENMQRQTIPLPPASPSNPLIFPRWNAITPTTGGFPYDDLHVQVTLGELQSTAKCEYIGPQIITSRLHAGLQGTFYSGQIQATGGTLPYAFKYPNLATVSINGITFDSNGNYTGKPIASGEFLVDVIVNDKNGLSDSKTLGMVFDSNQTATNPGPVITRQECLDACAISSNPGKSCEAKCPKN